MIFTPKTRRPNSWIWGGNGSFGILQIGTPGPTPTPNFPKSLPRWKSQGQPIPQLVLDFWTINSIIRYVANRFETTFASGVYGKTLPKTNMEKLEMDGWKTTFLVERPIFRGELLVSGRVLWKNQIIWLWFSHGWKWGYSKKTQFWDHVWYSIFSYEKSKVSSEPYVRQTHPSREYITNP